MWKGNVTPLQITDTIGLALLGGLLGAGAHWVNQDAKKATEISRGIGGSGYEACIELNEMIERFGSDEPKEDCEKDFLQ